MEKYVFWPTAVMSLGAAMGMILSPNAVHSALALVVNLFTLAVFYVLLEAHFLAAAQIVVYAGAIMVLFLFVIMLLGVDREEDLDEPLKWQRPLGVLLVGVLGLGLVVALRGAFDTTPFKGLGTANASGNVEGLGRSLFTSYLFPFEVTSLLLLVAAIGAMVIGKRRRAQDMIEEDEDA